MTLSTEYSGVDSGVRRVGTHWEWITKHTAHNNNAAILDTPGIANTTRIKAKLVKQ